MQSFLEAIVRMGIFMICAQALLQFRPNGSYEKYLKLLVSVMVLTQLFFPVINLFLGEELKMEEQVSRITQKVEETRKDGLQNAVESEGLLNRLTMDELRSKLEVGKEKQEISETEAASDELSGGQDITIDRIEVKIGEK